ncbi:MAG: hypothetical protein AAF171_11350 [Cyanobacteria bacterium P01_A01_bin.116]
MTYTPETPSVNSPSAGARSVWKKKNRLSAMFATALFLAGTAMPAVAQVKLAGSVAPDTAIAQNTAQFPESDDASTQAIIDEIVAEVVAEQTSEWDAEGKAVMKTVMDLEIDEAYLTKLSELPKDELVKQIKTDDKLSPLKGMTFSEEASDKAFQALALRVASFAGARLFEAVRGSVINEILRMSASNLYSMFTALRRGDMRQFRSSLSSAFPTSRTFVRLVGTAASSFCGTATLGSTPKTCTAFTNAAQTALFRARSAFIRNFSPSRRTYRPTRRTYRPTRRTYSTPTQRRALVKEAQTSSFEPMTE